MKPPQPVKAHAYKWKLPEGGNPMTTRYFQSQGPDWDWTYNPNWGSNGPPVPGDTAVLLSDADTGSQLVLDDTHVQFEGNNYGHTLYGDNLTLESSTIEPIAGQVSYNYLSYSNTVVLDNMSFIGDTPQDINSDLYIYASNIYNAGTIGAEAHGSGLAVTSFGVANSTVTLDNSGQLVATNGGGLMFFDANVTGAGQILSFAK
jgi:hypothetical protein